MEGAGAAPAALLVLAAHQQIILEAGPALTIRFEDIFADGNPGFRALVDAIGADWRFEHDLSFEKTNETRGGYVPRWQDWKPEWRQDAQRVFERAEEAFGVTRWYPNLLAC